MLTTYIIPHVKKKMDTAEEIMPILEEHQIDITELYQIPLGNKPRIIGYKTGKIFYLLW